MHRHAQAAESYLKIDRIISAAEIGNVQAIHPGYGFLAENAHFAEVCRDCNIAFIGPTPEAMAMLGDKNSARKMARLAEVPTVPGSEGLIESEAHALKLAQQLGFPVLIKAAAGGGGRGMRVALNELALKSALQQAQAEAEAAFGSSESTWKSTSSIPATWRSRSSPICTATRHTFGNATARCSAATRS